MTLTDLINQLHQAKLAEKQANQARLDLENQVLNHPDIQAKLKDEGSTSFKDLGLTIATGYTRTWSQAQLVELSKGIKPEFFPFNLEYKEDRKVSKVTEEKFPELWQQLSTALTLKPKKPTLTLKPKD